MKRTPAAFDEYCEHYIHVMRPFHGVLALLPMIMGITAMVAAVSALLSGADTFRGLIAFAVGLLLACTGYWVRPKLTVLIERHPYHVMFVGLGGFVACTLGPSIIRVFE